MKKKEKAQRCEKAQKGQEVVHEQSRLCFSRHCSLCMRAGEDKKSFKTGEGSHDGGIVRDVPALGGNTGEQAHLRQGQE